MEVPTGFTRVQRERESRCLCASVVSGSIEREAAPGDEEESVPFPDALAAARTKAKTAAARESRRQWRAIGAGDQKTKRAPNWIIRASWPTTLYWPKSGAVIAREISWNDVLLKML